MSAPRIYSAIAAITSELARSGIAKTQTNVTEQYAYRGIDEVCNRLAPLLAKYRVCILPRVVERASQERAGSDGSLVTGVALRVAFDFISARDASVHVVETYGEALDGGDKGTAKAMSAAYKQAVLLAFCIPVQGADDPDATTYRVKPGPAEVPDPDQGWEQWSLDIQDMIRICESPEALDRVQTTYRAQLRAASKRQPEVFAAIGAEMQARRGALGPRGLKSEKDLGVDRATGAARIEKVAVHA
jgi:hypothetical protein